ncbi:amidase [Bradyrhizobium yuanmingense]|uniref:amidase n=1 Tax=Bradyrhizobium yuanmingense TaxID=108015 RepID=UPI0023BA194F|nr:amidase [Bradyrhizobium yuanmingense]MDF0581979.1 amidase [Bradyrhizobium yuanmingense]
MTDVSKDILTQYRTTDALGLSDLVKRKEVRPSELMEAAIATAEELNPAINALVSSDYTIARKLAARCGYSGIFAGVPFLVKDLSDYVAGFTMTNGSRFYYRHARPSAIDSEAVRRARQAGMIPFGLTSTSEAGYAWTTEPALYGPTRNPWNPAFSTGGSSGGSAAAVAARIVPIASASDGGGSIRMPAGACGLVGLKPSRGRIPTYPSVSYGPGFTVLGCLSRTVRDTAAYLDTVSGPFVGDIHTPPTPDGSFFELSRQDPGRLRIGFTTALASGKELDREIAAAVSDTAKLLEGMGHHVERYDLSIYNEALRTAYGQIYEVETALRFQRDEQALGVKLAEDDIEPMIRGAIENGKKIDAVTHARNIGAVRSAGHEIAAELAHFDAFVCPVFPRHTFRLGEYNSVYEVDSDERNASSRSDGAFLVPMNASGLPAISLPTHLSQQGLPIGVQLMGRYGAEAVLLKVANALESAINWQNRCPPIVGAAGTMRGA